MKRKNLTKIRITGHSFKSDKELAVYCDKVFHLRTAKGVGEIETVNNTVLGNIKRNSLLIQIEEIEYRL